MGLKTNNSTSNYKVEADHKVWHIWKNGQSFADGYFDDEDGLTIIENGAENEHLVLLLVEDHLN